MILRGADMEKLSSSTFTNMMHICRGNMCKLGLLESGKKWVYIILFLKSLTLEIKLMILVLLLAPCSVENIN